MLFRAACLAYYLLAQVDILTHTSEMDGEVLSATAVSRPIMATRRD